MRSPSPPTTANPRPVPILVYHQIDHTPERSSPFRSLCVSPAAFARQMASLRALGWQGLSMGALMPYLRGERSGRVVGITFDDGYLNNLTHALPVLRRHGFSSTCYVVSGLMGQTNRWDLEQGVPQTPLMDASELQAWVDGGQEVGVHTRSHAHLPRLPEAEAHEEIAGGRDDLAPWLPAGSSHFCYPYGEFEPVHARMAQAAGFATSTTTQRGRVHAGCDWQALPRVPVLRSTSLPLFWVKLLSAYEDRRGH